MAKGCMLGLVSLLGLTAGCPGSTENRPGDGWPLVEASLRDHRMNDQPLPAGSAAEVLVGRLDARRFKAAIGTLAGYGSRFWSQPGNRQAAQWLAQELAAYGYTVERHSYSYQGQSRDNLYVTKRGTSRPQEMYIVAAHYDSYNAESTANAPGADDNASGTALVLEAARVFAAPDIETACSLRFLLFNNEETGLDGSKAYVASRKALQGGEEPTWLGVIVHDMLLYDHGLPPGEQQSAQADLDVEYHSAHSFGGKAQALAEALRTAAAKHVAAYPAEVGTHMANTDSVSFWEACPSVSVRENQRIAELGQGSNPQWHRSTDVLASYSDADMQLGFSAVQMTVGALAELAQAQQQR